jgi:hypothetical protein
MQDAGRSYTGTWDCMKSMAKNEGLSSFFRGSWLRIIRIAPGILNILICLHALYLELIKHVLTSFS